MTDNLVTAESTCEPTVSLSKRKLKLLEKRKSWEESKLERRKHERERKKKRKAEAKERGEVPQGPNRKQLKLATMKDSPCRLRVAVDVAFDHLMSQWDICKVCKQLQRCYSINRRLKSPLQFYITHFSGKTKDKLFQTQGSSLWDVSFKSHSYLEEFDKSEIIYLTSESPNTLEILEESKAYIIGGFVDHNKHKGLCLSLAEEHGVGHARLPITEHIDMKTRKVLTINDAMKSEGVTWRDAFLNTIPLRKGAKAKDEGEDNEDENESANSETLDNV